MSIRPESHHNASHVYLLSMEGKLTNYLVKFGRNPPNRRLENGVKSRLVSYTTSPCFSKRWQSFKVTFLNESHESAYLKSRYMRHVGHLLANAIAKRCPIPWHTVRELEHLRYEKSMTPAHVISGEDLLHVIPFPKVTSDIFGRKGSGEDELSGSQYQVSLLVKAEYYTLTWLSAVRRRWYSIRFSSTHAEKTNNQTSTLPSKQDAPKPWPKCHIPRIYWSPDPIRLCPRAKGKCPLQAFLPHCK